MQVKGKVLVVTGGGDGIGRQIVLDLLRRGATVAAADINLNGLNETQKLASSLAAGLSVHQVDIANRDSVAALVAEVTRQHGHVDGVVNNAGIIHPFKPVNDLDYGVIERVVNVNLYGVINVTKAFLPLLLARPEAHIVNVSSMGGLFAFPLQTVYGATKAAVKVLSEGLFAELRGTHVGVTVVYPGAIATDITKNSGVHNKSLEKSGFRGSSPQAAARQIVDGIEKNRFRVYVGMDSKVLDLVYRMNPRLVITNLSRLMNSVMSE